MSNYVIVIKINVSANGVSFIIYPIHHRSSSKELRLFGNEEGRSQQIVHRTLGLVTQLVTFISCGHEALPVLRFTPSGSVTSDI